MASLQRSLDSCIQQLQSRTLNQLKSIAKHEGVPSSGTKRALQDRIKTKLFELVQANDEPRLQQLRALISDPAGPNPSNAMFSAASTNHRATPPQSTFTKQPSGSHSAMDRLATQSSSSTHITFKESPFYTVLQSLTPVQQCSPQEATRGIVSCSIPLSDEIAASFTPPSPDRGLRIMIFCTADPPQMHSRAEIAFPSQIDIKVNGAEVKANFRGLKNKPGSTRPADITDLVTKTPRSRNEATISYALTNRPFFLVVNLVREQTCEALVAKLTRSNFISKEKVLSEMRSRSKESDVEATSTTMSLKCPLSTRRMAVPCRSARCTHHQCFDALSFIQLQQQAPTWTCPICNQSISFNLLHVDKYVSSILDSTSESTKQVTIEPDGKWSLMASAPTPQRHANSTLVDDDLVEIKEYMPSRRGVFPTPSSGSPTVSSREASIPSIAKSSGTKRSHSVIIDLTLSSDDENETPHEVKRPFFGMMGRGHESQEGRLGASRNASSPRPATLKDSSSRYNRPQQSLGLPQVSEK